MKRLEAWMMKLIREHPKGYRKATSVLYGLLIAWYLWDTVHQNPLWGIDYGCAWFMAAIWAGLARMWGMRDRADEITLRVVEATGDRTVSNYVWLWAYTAPPHEQIEMLHWMETHDMAAVHVDDMPPVVRNLARNVAAIRSM